MGIFSFLKKKEEPKSPSPDEKEALRKKRDEDNARLTTTSEMGRLNSQQQRDIARATALKIDAIESEMAFDIFNEPEPSWNKRPKRPSKTTARQEISDGRTRPGDHEDNHTLPLIELATTELLHDETGGGAAADVPDPATHPAIEEIAILYASEQYDLVEQMLRDLITEDQLGAATLSTWWILFDFYQILGRQDDFENLSIDYASKWETSPPSWVVGPTRSAPLTAPATAGVIPTVAFAGLLDDSIVKQLDKVQKLSEKSQVFRLEFARVTAVEPGGCELLLRALKTLQKTEHELMLVGAAELATKVRDIIQIGRRDETEAPWLLLLEILKLLDLEKDFEETSMDYCITFEVSPPAFEPPKNIKVTMAREEKVHPNVSPDRFLMPPVLSGNIDSLMAAIKDYAGQYNPVVIDCAHLTRIDFTAAGQLLSGLTPLSGGGRKIEFQDVNHLVAAMLQVMGINRLAKVFPHKY